MKSVKNISFFLLSLYMISCNKFLDTQPLDFSTPQSFYSTESQIEAALVAVYDPLGSANLYGNNLIADFQLPNDECTPNSSSVNNGPVVNIFDASDPKIAATWATLYAGIDRANLLLENIDKPSMDSISRNAIKGEALFLRAYYHFLLVIYWGDVPMKLTSTQSVTNVAQARAPSAQIYEQITNDMIIAEALVRSANFWGYSGHISRATVQGILARVYLYWAGFPLNNTAKYKDAVFWAKKVKDSGLHALNTSFRQVFINYSQDIYDIKESMWEVEFVGGTNAYKEGGRLGNTIGIQCNNLDTGYSYGLFNATVKLFNSFGGTLSNAKDVRRDWAISNYKLTGNNTANSPLRVSFVNSSILFDRNCGKWRRELEKVTPKDKNLTGQNFCILRYADVLLILAEAENELNGPTSLAHECINLIRSRAGISLYEGATAFIDKSLFRKAIQDERMRELCFEGSRRLDLIRWGIYITTMQDMTLYVNANVSTNYKFVALGAANTSERNVLYPIPTAEMNVNKLATQNPGW